MPKLTIELDAETHKILKQLASERERSLTQYIQRTLRKHAGTLTTTSTTDTTTVKENSQRSKYKIEEEQEDSPLWL